LFLTRGRLPPWPKRAVDIKVRHSGMLLARLRKTTAWQAGIQVFGR
jgi:hypothetical protein